MSSRPALIPAAGRGTRLRPITEYLSKPMLPVGSEPVIRYSINEALEAGCDPVMVVVSPEHDRLISYLRDLSTDISRIQWTEQTDPRGLGDALLVGYDALDGSSGSVATLIPDNVILSGGGIEPLLEFSSSNETVLGTITVGQDESAYFGNSGYYRTENGDPDPGIHHETIVDLQPKGSGSFSQVVDDWPACRTVPRYILGPKFFEIARSMDPDPESGELDEVPVIRKLLDESTLPGVAVDGEVYDMGNPNRYLRLCARLFETPEDFVHNDD